VKALFPVLMVLLASCRTARTPPASAVTPRAVTATPLPPGKTLRFEFAPAAGKTFVEESRVSRREAPLGGNGPGHGETVSASLSSRLDAAADGWSVLQRVSAVSITRDGKLWEDPLVRLVTQFPIKISVTAAGDFHALLNPADAAEAVRKTFSNPIERDTLLRYFTPEALESQARREWDQKYAGILGKDLGQGTALYSVETLGMTTGSEVRYVMERTLAGTATSPWGEAVVLSVHCIAKPEEARDPAAVRMLLDRDDVSLEPSSRCEGQQVIARSPFVPVRSWLSFHATPEPKGDAPKVEVSLDRDQAVHTLE
jgi:hypothetical protein